MSGLRRWVTATAAVLTAMLTGEAPALACAVCYGEADNPMLDGARLSVVFMLALTYLLLGGGVVAAVLVRRNLAKRDEGK